MQAVLANWLTLSQEFPGIANTKPIVGYPYTHVGIDTPNGPRTHHPAVGPLGPRRRAASSAARVM